MPRASSASSRRRRRASARWAAGSSTGPKWVRASRCGAQASTVRDRLFPELDVDVRRRGRRDHQVGRRDAAGGDVADEGGAGLLVQVADVVGGVAGRVGDAHPEHHLAARQRSSRSPPGPAGSPPEVLELVAVEALGAGQQARGVDQVGRAALVDVDRQVGPAGDHRAGRGGVVEVDVGEQDRLAAARPPSFSSRVWREDSGPGSTSMPSTSQQPITCGRPRCSTSMTRIDGELMQQAVPAGSLPSASSGRAQALLEAARLRSRARGSPSRGWPRR